MLSNVSSVATLLPIAIVSAVCIGMSLFSRFALSTRVWILFIGNALCSLNFLIQIAHTWSDVIDDNITCILDTQYVLLICSSVLFVVIVAMSALSCLRISAELKKAK